MRFARLAVAAVLIAVFELALGWRLSVLGVTPDLLFILACAAASGLRPGEGVPAACAIGLVADFFLGGRLGLMALSFGLGLRVVEGARPLLGRWRPDATPGSLVSGAWRYAGGGALPARLGGLFLLVLAGAAVAHATVALGGAVLGDPSAVGDPTAVGEGGGFVVGRLVRAAEIAFLTAAVAPLVWPALTFALGPLDDPEKVSGTFSRYGPRGKRCQEPFSGTAARMPRTRGCRKGS